MPAKWYRIDTASQRGIHETIQSTISDFYHHFYFQLAQNLSPLKTSPPHPAHSFFSPQLSGEIERGNYLVGIVSYSSRSCFELEQTEHIAGTTE